MGISRTRGVVAGLAATGMVVALSAGSVATAASQSGPATRVIVLLNNQSGNNAAAEAPVLSQVKAAGGTHVVAYDSVASFAATVSADEAAALAADPAVASVIPDTNVTITPAQLQTQAAAPGTARPAVKTPAPGACPADPAKPLVEPEALRTTHAAQVQAAGITGKGVTVGYIADGINPNNPDFLRNGKSIFNASLDFSGDGPDSPSGGAEAFGDASAIAAQGNQVYDLADFVNPAYALPKGCNIKIFGMAPGASLVGLKAGGQLLPNSAILQSIDWATKHHLDVLNESFGANVYSDNNARDTIQRFDDAAVRAGVTVTTSTGDAGITGTNGSPSTDPNLISAAASTDFQTYSETGYGAFGFSKGKWANSNISALSSGGITQGGRTPDLVAPGEADWALCDNTKLPDGSQKFGECTNYHPDAQGHPGAGRIQPFGGTSQSSPLTAGAAALVIQAFRDSHHGQSPTPALVKQFLTSTAHDLGLPSPEQGAGLLDADAAVKAARQYHGQQYGNTVGGAGQTLVSPQQATLEGRPGARTGTDVTVTNTGSKPETVKAGTRTFTNIPGSSHGTTVNMAPKTDTPFTYATNGATWVSKTTTFDVAKGADRLSVSTAWQGNDQLQPDGSTVGAIVRLTLIDPNGVYQTDSRPQGNTVSANHAFVDVRSPAAGKWTAVLYTPKTGPLSYTGPVLLADSTQKGVPDGSVSPSSLTLKAGQSGRFRVSTRIGGSHGDEAAAVTISSSNGQRSSVPLVLRPVVPISAGKGTFTGTITGGNARDLAPTETLTYAFDVPANRHDLDLGVRFARADLLVEGVLISPDGEAAEVGSNARLDYAHGTITAGQTMQLTQSAPVSGRWRLVLIVTNPVSGTEISQGFAGTIGFDKVKIASNLPAGAAKKLAAGKKANFTIKYTNNGSAPSLVQVDPRRTAMTDVTLKPFGNGNLALPLTPTSPVPAFLVPPGTQTVTLTSKATTPAQVELGGPAGAPDVFGDLTSAQHGALTSVARVTEAGGRHLAARGWWGSFVQQIGPFPGPAPSGTAVLSATARSQAFDPTVTSPTGDPYAMTLTGNPNGLPGVGPGAPQTVNAGSTGSISVSVTPSGKKGTVVRGVVYLVTSPVAAFNPHMGAVTTSGDLIAAVPYTYTIG